MRVSACLSRYPSLIKTRSLRRWVAVWICLTGVPATGCAHQWYLQPGLLMQTYYNDNLRLSRLPHSGVWGAVADVSAELGMRSEVSGISLTSRLRDYRYTGYRGVSHYDHLARDLDLNTFYKAQTSVWNLDATYNYDSTLTSELLDSGRVDFNVPRQIFTVNPSWFSQWTPRTSIQVDAGYTNTSYRNGLVYGLRNYQVLDGSATLGYNLTETQLLNLTASASRYTAPVFFNDRTDSYIVQGGWVNHWTERTVTNASGGILINQTRFDVFGAAIENTQQGYVVHANLKTGSERATWSADVSRNVDPTSFGVLMQTDQATFGISRGLTQYVDGSLNALWLHGKSLKNSFETVDRTLEQVRLSVDWRYAAHWSLRGQYTWTRQAYGPSAGRSNAVYVNLKYTGAKRYVSY